MRQVRGRFVQAALGQGDYTNPEGWLFARPDQKDDTLS